MAFETSYPNPSKQYPGNTSYDSVKLSQEQIDAIYKFHNQIKLILSESGLLLNNEIDSNLLKEIEKLFKAGRVQSEHDKNGDLIINSFVAKNWIEVAMSGKFNIHPDSLKEYMQSNDFLNQRSCELGLKLNNTLFINRDKNRDFKRAASLLEWTIGCLAQYLNKEETKMFLRYIYKPFLNPTIEDSNQIGRDFAWWTTQNTSNKRVRKR
jgi:hypothetical protein